VVWHVGASAFHRIRDERPQLVLLDINLINPGRGWNTLDALPLHPKTRHIPVILCATDMRLIEAKADLLCELNCQFLEKPFEIETLQERVTAAIGPPPKCRRKLLKVGYRTASGAIQGHPFCHLEQALC